MKTKEQAIEELEETVNIIHDLLTKRRMQLWLKGGKIVLIDYDTKAIL